MLLLCFYFLKFYSAWNYFCLCKSYKRRASKETKESEEQELELNHLKILKAGEGGTIFAFVKDPFLSDFAKQAATPVSTIKRCD